MGSFSGPSGFRFDSVVICFCFSISLNVFLTPLHVVSHLVQNYVYWTSIKNLSKHGEIKHMIIM